MKINEVFKLLRSISPQINNDIINDIIGNAGNSGALKVWCSFLRVNFSLINADKDKVYTNTAPRAEIFTRIAVWLLKAQIIPIPQHIMIEFIGVKYLGAI